MKFKYVEPSDLVSEKVTLKAIKIVDQRREAKEGAEKYKISRVKKVERGEKALECRSS